MPNGMKYCHINIWFFFSLEVCTLHGPQWSYMICRSVLEKKKLCHRFLEIFTHVPWVFRGYSGLKLSKYMKSMKSMVNQWFWSTAVILVYSRHTRFFAISAQQKKKKKSEFFFRNLRKIHFIITKIVFGLGAVIRVEQMDLRKSVCLATYGTP